MYWVGLLFIWELDDCDTRACPWNAQTREVLRSSTSAEKAREG